MGRVKSLTLGLLFGGAAAAVTTLLSTPYNGKQIRQKLKDQKQEIQFAATDVGSKAGNVKSEISTTVKQGNTIVKNVAENISLSLGEWQKQITPHRQSLEDHLSEINNSLSNLEGRLQKHENNSDESSKKEGN